MASKKKPGVKAHSPARSGTRSKSRAAAKPANTTTKPTTTTSKPAAARPAVPRPAAGKSADPAAETRRPVVARPRTRPRPVRAKAPLPRAAAESEVHPTLQDEGGPVAVPGLSEEDQIRAAKYLPREMPKRVFEEERFLFPETYGVDRVRLLVRDPEWIFAYWDVSPEGMKSLGRSLGERALALSRLTLRILDPTGGGSLDILLPPGARWWYVRTDSARRTYRAELGVTLPSGEFRRIAESNTVVTPRVGPSAESAARRLSYRDARELPLSASAAAVAAERTAGVARQPWEPGALEGAAEPGQADGRPARGGASDTFGPGAGERPGAGELPGASDAFRR